MQNSESSQIIPLPNTNVSDQDFVQQLSNTTQRLLDENRKLHQTVDETANTLAMQKELIQQLRDEIARLKGQKPKPKIPPSKLEGPSSKPDWRKRIGPYNRQENRIAFSLWVKSPTTLDISSLKSFSRAVGGSTSKERLAEISRLARLIFKRVRWTGKPGQPRGKPRRKKKTILQVHEKPVIQPQDIPEGARFKGFKRYTVQELIVESRNVQYQLARWQLPDGSYVTGELPKDVHGHYGP